MLYCMSDSFQSLTDGVVPMLETLVKYNKDDRVVNEAKSLLERFL